MGFHSEGSRSEVRSWVWSGILMVVVVVVVVAVAVAIVGEVEGGSFVGSSGGRMDRGEIGEDGGVGDGEREMEEAESGFRES